LLAITVWYVLIFFYKLTIVGMFLCQWDGDFNDDQKWQNEV
jgi:hypothetical protein